MAFIFPYPARPGFTIDLSTLNISSVLAGEASIATPTEAVIFFPSGFTVLEGTDFQYSPSEPRFPIAGTIQLYEDARGFLITGLNLPISQLLPAFQPTANDTAALTIMLAGDDSIFGSEEADNLLGYAGNDAIAGSAGNDTINGGIGFDTLVGGAGNDLILGNFNRDVLFGGAGNDTLRGGNGLDRLDGEAGDDDLVGGLGNDTIFGGDGNDTLTGGLGNDTLWGGVGNNQFYFASPNEGIDTIAGFVPLSNGSSGRFEQIVVEAAGFGGGLTPGVLDAGAFVLGSAATDAGDRFLYNSTNGALLFDVDGTGSAAAVQIATIRTSFFNVSAADIVVV